MYEGFLALAGTELVNSERAAVYSAALGITTVQCGRCPNLARALWSDPYTTPSQDDAPWYDPMEPASSNFAGFVGLEITGLTKSTAGRTPVPLTTGGASLHPLRRAHREIQVRVLALAKDECSMSYGLSWLAAALRGQGCGASVCGGDQLCFFTCCPPCDPPPSPGQIDLCGNPYWRTCYNVGLLEMQSPEIIRKIPGGYIAEVIYTLAAGDPFIYREPVFQFEGGHAASVLPNYTDPGTAVACFEPVDCAQDPDCPAPPAPVLPPIPVDICFPTGPYTAARVVLPVPQDKIPAWYDKVPLIIMYTGDRKIERLTFRWYANATGADCAANLDPCSACAEINLAFVPAGSTLTIDGRSETAYLDCAGGPGLSTAEPQLYGRGGTPFVWPSFSCNGPMCLEVTVKADTVGAGNTVAMYSVIREEAV